jgi:lysophospholipase L1-like esterase
MKHPPHCPARHRPQPHRPHHHGRARSWLTSAATVTAVAVAVVLFASPANAAAPTGRYVALGDSYTSGPLIPTQVDLNCTRSNADFPSLVKAAIGASAFKDVSCGGATTNDLANAGSGELGIAVPAQEAALSASTALVTLGIGGNDIGFSGIIETCAEDSLHNPLGSPCKNQYDAGGTDQLLARINATAPKVATALQQIHALSPNARVLVVGYPDILPTSGVGCWPAVPISWGDVPYMRSVEVNLNAMLATAAVANGATYVDTYASTVGHDACQSKSNRWVEGLVPGTSAAPFHPNANGEAAMARAVEAVLNR